MPRVAERLEGSGPTAGRARDRAPRAPRSLIVALGLASALALAAPALTQALDEPFAAEDAATYAAATAAAAISL
ncbi:hypothetical protein, partial [Phenylobacterium sp.]|uniref:hypothetical protein n=1 Tax=Phenylobacterium sp. TaxID=1871053 RepID=UPI0030F42652